MNIIVGIVAAVLAALAGYFVRRYVAEKKIQDAEAKAKFILEQAKKRLMTGAGE